MYSKEPKMITIDELIHPLPILPPRISTATETSTTDTEPSTTDTETNIKATETNIKVTETNIKVTETNIKATETNITAETPLIFTCGDDYFFQLGDALNDTEEEQSVRYDAIFKLSRWTPPCSVRQIACSAHWTGVILNNGSMYGWGMLCSEPHRQARKINVPEPVQEFACGRRHVLALSESHRVYAWGYGGYGQLGQGTLTSHEEPKEIQSLSPNSMRRVRSVGCGGNHCAVILEIYPPPGAIKRSGTGQNKKTKPSIEKNHDIKEQEINSINSKIVYGEPSSIVVYTWGANRYGQCGAPAKRVRTRPTKLPTLHVSSGIPVSFTGGRHHSVLVTSTGHIYTWGAIAGGRLGQSKLPSKTIYSATPNRVYLSAESKHNKNDSDMQQINLFPSKIQCGDFHTLVLTKTGRIFAWGVSFEGACGHMSQEQVNMLNLARSCDQKDPSDAVIQDLPAWKKRGLLRIPHEIKFPTMLSSINTNSLNEIDGAMNTIQSKISDMSIDSTKHTNITTTSCHQKEDATDTPRHDTDITTTTNRHPKEDATDITTTTSRHPKEDATDTPKNADQPTFSSNIQPTIIDIFAGANHSGAIDSNGQIWTWGDGQGGLALASTTSVVHHMLQTKKATSSGTDASVCVTSNIGQSVTEQEILKMHQGVMNRCEVRQLLDTNESQLDLGAVQPPPIYQLSRHAPHPVCIALEIPKSVALKIQKSVQNNDANNRMPSSLQTIHIAGGAGHTVVIAQLQQ